MRVRSWMAALALIGASSILIGRGISAQGSGRAQEASSPKAREAKEPSEKSAAESPRGEPQGPGSQPDKRRDSAPKLPTIRLNLAIAGLGAKGCMVEVKPANPSCRFRPSPSTHVASDGHAMIELHDVELRGADKTCTMAITVREPGQPPQTIYRGFRTASVKPGSVPPPFTCLINSRLAGVETKAIRK